ncbi:lipid-A-disaccharide synthase [Defluviimonas sp. 20V17]|uniref:Lipid-A-disaccharide synthase n=1 Tax=Allgaiera indica TaxID=765699 RepID=A0AAN5A026_9RHOB|nr:lipid-A-disaccharide synthase [Allgaiera indica]KDB02855.1 lipid-A-disaccharide synthase [Defluviimonas sp. 20V17]GHE01356.1 lipid-A-disaccharide synthase [Allgaiera indica]SDW85343.1 lipid-A-disaccharide synthase [Allgaiera indica]
MKLFLVAGEASGDRLGAALMEGLKTLAPGVAFAGVGGPLMQAQGLQSLFPMDELSVMGIAEILPKYRKLRRRLHQTAEAVLADPPDALITIDSPDFCLRVARLVRARRPEQRTIHYVAPSVWAWRPGRAAKMAEVIDHVLALLPFEPPLMQAVGMSCDFVGHPVVAEPRATAAEAQAFRETHGIGKAPLILVLPGSRRGEVGRLGPVFGAALGLVVAARPEARVVLPTVAHVAGAVRAMAAAWPGAPVVVETADDKRAAFAAADVALAASGTVSLELAANAVPMVIGYNFNRLTWEIIKRRALIDTVTLVNLVSDTRVVPEFLGPACRAEAIAPALLRMMAAGPERAAELDAMAVTMQRLGAGGEAPGLRAARSVLGALGHRA